MSTIKLPIDSVALTFPAESVTLNVQLAYIPSLKVLKVTVIEPAIAEVVLEEQEPP